MTDRIIMHDKRNEFGVTQPRREELLAEFDRISMVTEAQYCGEINTASGTNNLAGQ